MESEIAPVRKNTSYQFHVGLAPYRDQQGTRRACYQLLEHGYAIAIADFSQEHGGNVKLERMASVFRDDLCMGTFLADAASQFRQPQQSPDFFKPEHHEIKLDKRE